MLILLNVLYEPYKKGQNVHLFTTDIVELIIDILNKNNKRELFFYAVLCIEKFTAEQVKLLLANDQIMVNLIKSASALDGFSAKKMYKAAGHFSNKKERLLQYQISFACRWLFDFKHLLNIEKKTNFFSIYKLHKGLDSKTASKTLKFSPDCFSARCGDSLYKLKSARSEYQFYSGVYFYEVILLTSGPMVIGWSSGDQVDCVQKGSVGKSEHLFGFDGYHHCLWSIQKKQKQSMGTTINHESWIAGDVIGCLVDVGNSKFVFYLNGIQIANEKCVNTKGEMDATRKSFFKQVKMPNVKFYCAAVSLYPHQQCYFNFGQVDFKYKPDCCFSTFYESYC